MRHVSFPSAPHIYLLVFLRNLLYLYFITRKYGTFSISYYAICWVISLQIRTNKIKYIHLHFPDAKMMLETYRIVSLHTHTLSFAGTSTFKFHHYEIMSQLVRFLTFMSYTYEFRRASPCQIMMFLLHFNVDISLSPGHKILHNVYLIIIYPDLNKSIFKYS